MRNWVLIAGLTKAEATPLRRELTAVGYEIVFLQGERSADWQKAYAEFIRSLHGDKQVWVALVGSGAAADDLARSYYDYYRICPPHVLVLLSPRVTAYHLNNITCPFEMIHAAKDTAYECIPREEFEWAVYRHQMRYGDPTINLVMGDEERDLKKDGALDQRVCEEVRSWLEQVPALGYAKEGVHARGFRLRPFEDLKRHIRSRLA